MRSPPSSTVRIIASMMKIERGYEGGPSGDRASSQNTAVLLTMPPTSASRSLTLVYRQRPS